MPALFGTDHHRILNAHPDVEYRKCLCGHHNLDQSIIPAKDLSTGHSNAHKLHLERLGAFVLT